MLLGFLLLGGIAVAAIDTPLRPAQLRDVSLQRVPLVEGERIASIEVEVAGASFDTVHVPIDWSFDVGAPVSGVAVLKGAATHGVGMPFTTGEFQRFLRLAVYDDGYEPPKFSIKVKLGLYLNETKKGESERLIELSPECIVLANVSNPDRVSSIEDAYQIVIAYAAKHHIGDNRPGEFFCDFSPKKAPYFVVSLHHSDESAPKDWHGSTLVGIYGVHQKDGSLVEWDVPNDVPGKIIDEPKP